MGLLVAHGWKPVIVSKEASRRKLLSYCVTWVELGLDSSGGHGRPHTYPCVWRTEWHLESTLEWLEMTSLPWRPDEAAQTLGSLL